ncbi:EamA family transporter RarD [Acidaminobacter sp. JC074]|uniref:EamA family transporter RarD n=1 Tax=Acidaminobacter sp. JC074 TaxID=2530199 RepID=UPI001F0D2075|nr:EamA family transporter RarD [Acidaminobacter sp. JC074]MCH4886704.1 EamA family transporter RarD [Acidaminobacter sp. JC074]
MNKKEYIKGLIYGGLAFIIWGLLPLYWKLVKALNPYQVFTHRVFWSVLFVSVVMIYKKQFKDFLVLLKDKNNWLMTLGPAFFISINWLTYIWGVNNGFVIETSLGYYMNPLVLTLLGAIFYRERLDRLQAVGIGLAGIGVLIKVFAYGDVPVLALVLAISFAVYGLLKKKSKFTSLTGLGFETVIVGIPATLIIVFTEVTGQGIQGNLHPSFWLLIALSGALTAIPLLLYGEGTKRLPLKVVGFLQYIAPTIGLFLGIFVFNEPFSMDELVPFLIIWAGLICFVVSQVRMLKN